MAIIRQGILGLFRGKVGDLVGSSRDNLQYIKRLTPNSAQRASSKQLAEPSPVGILNLLLTFSSAIALRSGPDELGAWSWEFGDVAVAGLGFLSFCILRSLSVGGRTYRLTDFPRVAVAVAGLGSLSTGLFSSAEAFSVGGRTYVSSKRFLPPWTHTLSKFIPAPSFPLSLLFANTIPMLSL